VVQINPVLGDPFDSFMIFDFAAARDKLRRWAFFSGLLNVPDGRGLAPTPGDTGETECRA